MSNQKWTNDKSFSSYEEALEYKNNLQHSPEGAILEIKIKRCNDNQFFVKIRTHPELVEVIQKLDEEILKSKSKINKKKG